MRACTYYIEHGLRAGIVVDDLVVEAAAAARAAGLDGRTAPRELIGLPLDSRRALVDAAAALASAGDAGVRPLSGLTLGPPLPDPEKIVCLGLNYVDHAAETGLEIPTTPILFAKFRNSLIGTGQPIVPPPGEGRVDYEAELAVVIGGVARAVPEARALDYVAAVMPFNDVSARDLQFQTNQWTAGKAVDTFAPCGPTMVTLDEIDDIQALPLRARVNDEVVQDGTTADMIFSVAAAIAFVSSVMTLVPGDIIATGTPAGVGYTREPPLLLSEGDVVEVEVEGVGTLRNPVAAAAASPLPPLALADRLASTGGVD